MIIDTNEGFVIEIFQFKNKGDLKTFKAPDNSETLYSGKLSDYKKEISKGWLKDDINNNDEARTLFTLKTNNTLEQWIVVIRREEA